MPFYFRKSVTAGPFRFNFSKGGVGASVGVKGFRIGTGPKGHYVHAGRGGVYYRATIPNRTKKPWAHQSSDRPSFSTHEAGDPGVAMTRVSSGDVLAMQDERFADLLSALNARQASVQFAWLLGVLGLFVGFLAMATFEGGFLWLLGATVFGAAIGSWMDGYRRSEVLFYELDEDARSAYENITRKFDGLMACSARWHVDAGGAVRDIHTWKRNAGASHILARRSTTFSYALPPVVKSNITPPAIKVGKETVYFLPDVALVVENRKIGAVAYDSLNIRWEDSYFIEDGIVPADATVIRHTWQHPNKNGGPDRRFANNRQIPVCLYETIHLTSRNGLNELLQISRSGLAQPFAQALAELVQVTGKMDARLALPNL